MVAFWIDVECVQSARNGHSKARVHVRHHNSSCTTEDTPYMKPAIDDLPNRRPVWEALSDLFLDTDVSLARNWRIEKLAASPYSVKDLERILIHEVHPICVINLFSVAGEWAGFDQIWLENRILHHLASRTRTFRFLNLAHLTVPFSSEWRATKAGIFAVRTG